MQEIDKFATDNVCKVLVGNKIDKVSERKVSKEEGEELAKHYNIPYIETSAKQNMNVEESFITMASQIKKSLLNKGQFDNSRAGASGFGNGKNQGGYGKGTRLEPTPNGDDEAMKLGGKKSSPAAGGCC